MSFADQGRTKKHRVRRTLTYLQLEAKARQAAKVEEVRRALIVAGYRTIAEQAFVLGVNRSTAWALLNRARRAGPSAIVLKRILSSHNLPHAVRRKVEEYIKEKSTGRYAHDKRRVQWFRDQFRGQFLGVRRMSALLLKADIPRRP